MLFPILRLSIVCLCAALLACESRKEQQVTGQSVAPAPLALDILRESVEADLHKHIAVLASDAFGGRAPATEGEELTVAYLIDAFKSLGLEPGNGDSWVQPVPITSVETDPGVVMAIRGSDYSRDLAYATEMMVGTQQQLETVAVKDAEMVFVGYGINAPERGWNDYADLDVRGKTVVMLINDPGFATQDPALFNGNAMTYYGRWVYKYEEAARQGAAAALIVHQTAPASYPWGVVRGSWRGPQIGLTADDQNRTKVKAESWITESVARELFAAAGKDFEALADAATQPGFKAVPLGDLRMSVTLNNSLESAMSNNVLARLPGTRYPEEHIVYSAHWDHLGVRDATGSDDKVFNGASDNASGTAALISLARLHKAAGAMERSVLFLAVTAEESGLLGSQWYAENPTLPLETTVANLNMDNLYKNVDGRTRDIAVVGFGNSELEDYLQVAAKVQDRVITQEPTPEKGYYYRSDHINFARHGVPALYLTRAVDSREHGAAWGKARQDAYTEQDYHKPSDEYDPNWDLSGSAEDVLLLFGIAEQLGDSRSWPNWREGTEFKALRDASAASRAE